MVPKKVQLTMNKHLDMRKLLENAGHWISQSGVLFCPFHPDRHRESAKVYENYLWCFTEGRRYYPHHFIELFYGEAETKQLTQTLKEKYPEEIQKTKSNSSKSKESVDGYIKEVDNFFKDKTLRGATSFMDYYLYTIYKLNNLKGEEAHA